MPFHLQRVEAEDKEVTHRQLRFLTSSAMRPQEAPSLQEAYRIAVSRPRKDHSVIMRAFLKRLSLRDCAVEARFAYDVASLWKEHICAREASRTTTFAIHVFCHPRKHITARDMH